MRRSVVRASLVALPLVVMGCGNKSSGSGDAAPSGGGSGKGLDAAGNDPAVVALAKKALACTWNPQGPKYDCADRKAWESSDLFKGGKNDATLVAMLEDGNEQVRWLAANRLVPLGSTYRGDKVLAERALNAVLAEKGTLIGRTMGNVAGNIKLSELGLVEKARPLFKAPTPKEIRIGFLDQAQFNNRDAYYAAVTELAKSDPDKDIRMAAYGSFWTGTPKGKTAEVCQLWFDITHDANEQVGSHAAYYLSFYSLDGGCAAKWDGMLDDIEKRAKAGTAKSSDWPGALYYMSGQKGASDAQKGRAVTIAKALAENAANGNSSRARALDVVAERDAAGAKAYLEKFANDPDTYLKGRAQELLKKAK